MTRFSRIRLIPLLIAPALSGCNCNCGTDVVGKIAPQIYLDVCDKPANTEINGKLIGGFEDCKYDFGARDISVKITKKITVTNPSPIELSLEDVKVVGDPSFAVEIEDAHHNRTGLGSGDVVPAGSSGEIIVTVRPNTEALIKTSLFILSDANNTEQTPEGKSLIEVPLTATGVDNGKPDIVVTPLDCDFGRTPVGGVQLCPVKISNAGNRGLVLDSVEFVPPGDDPTAPQFQTPTGSTAVPFAFVGRPPGPDEEIPPTVAPAQPVTLQVRFTPDTLGNYQGKVNIHSNDPDQESVNVTLSGIAVTPPTCVAKVKSVNGVEVGDSVPQIEPLDDVVVTLSDSTPSTQSGSIVTFQWQDPPGRPAGSTIQIANPTGVETGFTFADTVGVDLAGEYHVCGEVFDDLGTGSVNECCATFSAIPHDSFLVQLSWDTEGNDLDLHVTQRQSTGEFCAGDTSGSVTGPQASECGSDLDCNFATCRTSDSNSPDWDGVAGRTVGDPTLDIDDIDGFGPENITVDTMPGGDYLVSVEGYSVFGGDAGATIRIFIFGHLAGEFFNEISDNVWWEAAIVRWPTDITVQQPCVEDLTDGNATDDCGP